MVERFEHLEGGDAQPEHFGTFPALAFPRSNFDRAILKLLRLKARNGRDGLKDGRRAAMIAVFHGRATYDAIRAWRRGAPVPAWAREILMHELGTIAQEAQLLNAS